MGVAPQSEEMAARGLRALWILLSVAGIIGLVVFVGIWISGTSKPPSTKEGKSTKQKILGTIRDDLSKSTTLETCRLARISLNDYLGQDRDRVLPLSEPQIKFFKDQVHLNNEEIQELGSTLF